MARDIILLGLQINDEHYGSFSNQADNLCIQHTPIIDNLDGESNSEVIDNQCQPYRCY